MTREERKIYNYWLTRRSVNNTIEKRCTQCEEWKEEIENYYLRNKSKPEIGYSPECKVCAGKRALKWSNANIEKKRESCRKNSYTPNIREYHKNLSQKQRDSGWTKEYYDKHPEQFQNYSATYSINKGHKITVKEWIKCKDFFDYECAYCGMPETEHKEKYKQQLHQEHAYNKGDNGISNCVPSCRICNSTKRDRDWVDWFTDENPRYTIERYNKINEWLDSFNT